MNHPLRIVLGYLLAAGLWILLSDRLLLALVGDAAILTLLQSSKGLLFVAVSAAFVYWVARRTPPAESPADDAADRLVRGPALLVFFSTLLIGILVILQIDQAGVRERRKAARDTAQDHVHALQAQMDRSLSATYALAAMLKQKGGRIEDFDSLAREMLGLYPGISALQLAPGGVVSRVVPLAGNEGALGHDLLRDARRNAEARAAIETRELTLAGPFELVQGGTGMVGRLPVFLANGSGREHFWGFTIALLRTEDFIRASRLAQMEEAGYQFELYRILPDTGAYQMIAQSSTGSPKDPVLLEISVPNGIWKLAVAPRQGWHAVGPLVLESTMALFISALLSWITYFTQRQPALLRREVQARTRELRAEMAQRVETEGRLRKLARAVEQNPVTVVITDPQGTIEYVNPTFTRITGYSTEEAIGSNPRILKSGLMPPELYAGLWQTILAGEEWRGEVLNRKKNGDLFWESEIISPLKDEEGRVTHFIAVKEDITERRATEHALMVSNRTLRVLSLCNQALIRSRNEAELFTEVCRHLMVSGGYCLAWVARLHHDGEPRLQPFSAPLPDKPSLSLFATRLDDGAAWQDSLIGRVIGKGRTEILKNLGEDALFSRWLDSAALCGCQAVMALPLQEDGIRHGALVVHTQDPDAFGTHGETELLDELASDLAFGIRHLAQQRQQEVFLAALEESENQLRAITCAATDAIILIDGEGRILFWNPAAETLFGYGREEALGRDMHALIAGPCHAKAREGLARFAADGSGPLIGKTIEVTGHHKNGAPVAVELSISALRLQGRWCALGLVRDVTARKSAEEQIRLQTSALDSAGNAILITRADDPERAILYANQAFGRITGYAPGEVLGRNLKLLLGDDWDQEGVHELRTALAEKVEGRALLRCYRKNGSLFWNELLLAPVANADGTVTHFVTVMNDVTKRVEYEHQLAFHANYDTLTGLPNRNLAADRVEQAIAYADRYERQAAVVELDLDHFKRINDTLGHAAGDELIKTMAARLREELRDGDTLARLGGDEFLLVFQGIEKDEMLPAAIERLLGKVRQPVELAGQQFEISASVGISVYPQDAEDGPTLLKYADTALFRAKEAGRGGYHFFTPELNTRVAARLTLEAELKRALEREELELFYQPQVDLRTGKIAGAEALMRWRHPERGLVSPALFIPVAEESGLITPMGDWALHAACRQVKHWLDARLPETTVAVNLSARQFRDRDVARLVAATLEQTGCPAHLLEVELTESLVIQDIDRTIEVLSRLREMKVAASMDDFGTGYSSLSQLRRLSLSTLKIDQSFVRDIVTDPHSATIAGTIIAMAHALGLKVIAEGVETEAQLSFLRGKGCDEMQGYYFSRPVPAAEFAALIREGRGLAFGADPGEDPSRTLLLVDDEINILSALKRLLRRDGYTILTASSGQEGLELLARHQVGVIVSDQRMPEMTGTEFLSRVKEIHPESVRMVLSGYSELSTLTEAINRGAVYKFLAKPWDEEDLRATIKEAFRRYDRLRREGKGQ